MVICFINGELGMVMQTRKDPAPSQRIQNQIRVTPGNVDTVHWLAIGFSFNQQMQVILDAPNPNQTALSVSNCAANVFIKGFGNFFTD
jgi:hypothetical protein